jgi:hypothetical protein
MIERAPTADDLGGGHRPMEVRNFCLISAHSLTSDDSRSRIEVFVFKSERGSPTFRACAALALVADFFAQRRSSAAISAAAFRARSSSWGWKLIAATTGWPPPP